MKSKHLTVLLLFTFFVMFVACSKKQDPVNPLPVPTPIPPSIGEPVLLDRMIQRFILNGTYHEYHTGYKYDNQNRLIEVTDPVRNTVRVRLQWSNTNLTAITRYDTSGNVEMQYIKPMYYSKDSIRLTSLYPPLNGYVDTLHEVYLFKDSAIIEERFEVRSSNPWNVNKGVTKFEYDDYRNFVESYDLAGGVKMQGYQVWTTDDNYNVRRLLGPMMYIFGNMYRANGMGVNNVTKLSYWVGDETYHHTFNERGFQLTATRNNEPFAREEFIYQ